MLLKQLIYLHFYLIFWWQIIYFCRLLICMRGRKINISKELEQAFEKLLYNLSIAIHYQPYSDDKVEYMEMLDLIAKQKIQYDEYKDFNILSSNILNDVHLRSLPLLEKYAIENGNYAEQIEIWSDYLLNIKKSK